MKHVKIILLTLLAFIAVVVTSSPVLILEDFLKDVDLKNFNVYYFVPPTLLLASIGYLHYLATLLFIPKAIGDVHKIIS